ncbi:ABC1 kinase family protein [Mycolicibacterium sphagni]|uniref:ABC1 atypical kinase-like domain-containing protein n=1 Tax=Mycolicibacterium sphagni TaxID=1786 RepID=A0A255DYL8_9MYCO|nr:AarF/ABC1/UbiB kinase family protein [Mycolicibacterium sphagni]MCV7178676.1 AarF/ABC1/UbiB kinase family protein [Mycolicibacterium sphagni]OYN82375.1 hypothetical protein CG716_03735 [Mycolicibacterium sphagni]
MSEGEPSRNRATRGASLGRVAVSHASRTVVRRVREPFLGEEDKARIRDEQVLKMADDLVVTLGSMKGAAMKLGQALALLNLGLSSATARDEFSAKLAPLFRKAPPVDNTQMFRVLDADLGANRAKIHELEPIPIAAASLGQVYRGTLADGRVVAVKIQYPSAKPAVRADLKNLALLVRLRARSLPDVGLLDLVDEITDQITLELDYQRELANHRAVYEAHRGHPIFRIPEPIVELCGPRVLVTEYLAGTELDRADSLTQQQRDWLGEAIYRFYCGNLHTTGKFCADPHPGNILLLDDGQVGFVDFGLYVEMRSAEMDLERKAFAAVLGGDADTAYRLAVRGGFIVDQQAMPAEQVLTYLQTVASWHLTPGVNRITAKTVHKSLSQAILPGSEFRRGIYRQQVPRAHLFSRRTEMSVCGLLGTLEAQAPWRAISEEWILGAEPATAMGQANSAWRATLV